MRDPFAAAARVAAGIASADDLAWLREGFRAWQRAAGDVALDRCLHLSAPKRGRLEQRDALLAELAGVVEPRPGEGTGTAMLREIRAFERNTWPRWSALTVAPAGADHAERILFDLLALRVSIPATARGLRMRLAGKPSGENASDVRRDARRAA